MIVVLVRNYREFPRQKHPSRKERLRSYSALRMLAVVLWILMLSGTLSGTPAYAIQNTATGAIGGSSLIVTNATVTLTRAGNAVTSAVSEINPHTAAPLSAGNIFTYDVLPTINGGDTGVDRVAVTAPAGYSALGVTAVSVGGFAETRNCPVPGVGQYCAVVASQVMTVTLGTKVAVTSTDIRITFSATAPAAPGSAAFSSTVDDSSTAAVPAQATVAGDANGNNGDGNNQNVTVTGNVVPSNLNSTVTATPQMVIADGVNASTITIVLRDSGNQPIPGKAISLSSDRGADLIAQPALPTDAGGTSTGTIRSTVVGVSTLTATDGTDGIVLSARPQVFFTQGQALELRKSANKKEAVVGDVINYLIEISNKTVRNVTPVRVDDQIPPNFKYVKGSARLNGSAMKDPTGNRTLTFDIGVVPALVDANGNGRADPGEPGYMTLTYQLVVGSGATPRDYVNTAAAKDVCDECFISNPSEATVTVTLDPLLDLGTIIGKVFEDKNSDGWQDQDEPGVPGAMVVLDNGDYSITDEFGRFHFPAVKPGHRLVKINILSLPVGSSVTTDEALVVSVTPGLLAKANFGVITRRDTEAIGRPRQTGMGIKSEAKERPVQVVGSAETLDLMINGTMASLPASDIRMSAEGPYEIVELNDGKLAKPVQFNTDLDRPDKVASWELVLFDGKGAVFRTLSMMGALPRIILWDGLSDQKKMVKGGEIYQYQLEITSSDGSQSKSARRIFGVNHSTAIYLNLTGGAFETGSAKLSRDAESMLKRISDVLRQHPQEKIIIEGHTDTIGSAKENIELSKRRVESAIAYLVSVEKIPEDRFVPMWYGMSRPIANNATPEGRSLNRRVVIKGEVHEIDKAKLIDEYRTKPEVRINGSPVRVDDDGRFASDVQDGRDGRLQVEMMNAQGRSVKAEVSIPHLEIFEPTGAYVLPFEEKTEDRRADTPLNGKALSGEIFVEQRLLGRTSKENAVELDGEPLSVGPDGTFTGVLKLRRGSNLYGLLVRNPQGYTRIAMLTVTVADRDDKGNVIIAVKPIPKLAVKFPPKDAPLKDPLLTVIGETELNNRVELNGEPAKVQADGHFAGVVKLPKGTSRVVVRVIDPEGNEGSIEREVTVSDTQLFFLAFADGVAGQLHGKGYLDGAGMEKSTKYYTEGRAAYYLKGTIAGKYLITSAFDTGTHEFNQMFKNLNATENDRLLTNLDPDKIYPVYGDSSVLVHDAQSQGKFYLAVDSDDLHILVGNYPLGLTDTELATYKRTLYGARASYQSVSRTQYGNPDTQVVVFGAEALQAHVQDELRATGGSLYYLSHPNIIEGSEQVTLVVRDKNTGLLVKRISEQQNVDYTVKYEEGRILFNRPIASVVQDALLVNQGILPGNPVFIQVDYETRLDSFEKSAGGGRVRQQLGDHVAVGGTYVKDELQGKYELQGVDTEVRIGKNTRIVGEYAETTGTSSLTFVSNDGGLTYGETTPMGIQEGKAWKAAAEVDVGEMFNAPDRLQFGGYFKKLESGFLTNGNSDEGGSQKSGANMKLQLTQNDKILGRYDRNESEATATSGAVQTENSTVQYVHSQKWWEFAGEYQSLQSQPTNTSPQDESSNIAARLQLKPTDKLTVSLLRQETITGVENNQTTLRSAYQVLPPLALEGSATQGTVGQSAQGGLVYKTGDKQLYLTERVSDDRSGQLTSTIIGSDYQFAPSSKVYSEYQWEHSDAGSNDRTISLVGGQRQWDAAKGLTFLLYGEESSIHSSPTTTDRSTLGAGLSYKDASGLKASTRNEVRYETGVSKTVQYLTVNRIELKLNDDFTAIGSYRRSITRDLDLNRRDAAFDERVIGLAYRPVAHDLFNALAKYTWLLDQRPTAPGVIESVTSMTNVISAEWSLQFNRYLEWVEKAAAKIKQENSDAEPSYTTHTYLLINRLNFNVWRKIDLGAEYRILAEKEAKDQREGWLVELLWKPVTNLRLGVGYNFTNFSDNEFSNNNYSVQGWFIRLQGKY